MDSDKKNNIIIQELQIENKLLMENQVKNENYIKKLKNDNKTTTENLKIVRDKLESIEYSRSYKLIQKIKKIINRR